MKSFDDFMDSFYAQLEFQIDEWIRIIDKKIENDEKDTLTSPLVGATFEDCILTGKDPLRGGGFKVDNYQLLSGTVSTAADSLRAVEYCVFENNYCSLPELKSALAADFEGYELLRQRLLHAPKYGNGDKRVNELASAISAKFINQVNAYRSKSGKRIRPGLYNIDFKIFANITGATPDGRKFRDPIGEHCSPTPGVAKCGPTAIVESASFLPMSKGYASSVLHLTLDGSSFVMGADREAIIGQMMEASQKAGVPVWNLAMYEKSELEDAKTHPELHKDLIVRVWGFNARFVELDEELQDHIINRIS
jgi:formate C-acetyltransferase